MGQNYEHSLEIRRYTTASAAGFDGDEDIAVGGNTTHVGAAASASGAHPSDVVGSCGSGGGPSDGRQQGDQQYYGRPAYLSGPPAHYAGGYHIPSAPPPSVPWSAETKSRVPYVAPRFCGNNYSTVPAMGYSGHHASARPSVGVPSGGCSNVSAQLVPPTSPPTAPADLVNQGAFGDAEDNHTGRVMPAGGSGSVAPAAAAAASAGSLPPFSQAPLQQQLVPPPSQAPSQQQFVPPPLQAPSLWQQRRREQIPCGSTENTE